MAYLDTLARVYADLARFPQLARPQGRTIPLILPGLQIPAPMQTMHYGCGLGMDTADLAGASSVAYVGVGGGLEALQLAYFCRRPGSVIGVEPMAELREAAQRNLQTAAALNDWFDPSFVEIRAGDPLNLPIPDQAVERVVQTGLIHLLEPAQVPVALRELARVLQPGGRLILSDPIAARPLPLHLQTSPLLRGLGLSGALTYGDYIQQVAEAGFGQIEVRARRPYHLLEPQAYQLDAPLLLEYLEIVAIKHHLPADGVCVLTGKTAIYLGSEAMFDDQAGHVLQSGVPLPICDKTAAYLSQFEDIFITDSTWHYSP